MPAWTSPLHPALAPYVSSCVGFDYRLPEQAVHHGLPSTSLTVVLSFEEPLDCGWLGSSTRSRYWALVSGLHDNPALIRTHGVQHGLQLALTPAGARTLLGLPAAALAREMVEAGADAGTRAAFPPGLLDRLAGAGWQERFTVVQRHLLVRSRGHDDPGMVPEVAEAWRLVRGSHGRLGVQALADRVGWSRRHLLTRFSAELGLTPKQAARVARFEHAGALAASGVPWAEVAHSAGYADQSHLTRDWRRLAGQTPAQSAEEFPIVLEHAD